MEEIGSRATIFELEGLGRVGNPGDTWWSRYRVGINPSFRSLWGPFPNGKCRHNHIRSLMTTEPPTAGSAVRRPSSKGVILAPDQAVPPAGFAGMAFSSGWARPCYWDSFSLRVVPAGGCCTRRWSAM